jgi:hypothetical protein
MTQARATQQLAVRLTSSTKSFDSVLAGWLRIFSRHYRQELLDDDLPIYADLLSDLSADVLDKACRQAMKTCRFRPTVADIRGQLDTKRKALGENEAEEVWQEALEYVNEWCHPDGIAPFGAVRPVLSSRVDHALRAAGGGRYLWGCPTEKCVWAKKAFIEDYIRQEEVLEAEKILGPGEILRRLTVGQPMLAPANPDCEKKYTLPETPQIAPKLSVVKREPAREMTQEEWDARRAFLRAQTDEVTKKYCTAQ